jgi:biotin carboxyl carrier protein
MRADYNMTGKDRKALVDAIATITGEAAEYQFVPTCAYKIGNITVDKEGGVSCDDEEKLNRVMTALGEKGFIPVAGQQAAEQPEAAEEPAEPAQEPETEEIEETGLTISLPLSSASVGNLTNLLTAKGDLIRKALGVDDIRIEVTEDKILFPWFKKVPEADEAKAYTDFIAAICKLSNDQKHVSATPHPVENEKYAFRCFLLRLGFIGAEYKPERKILLRNLSGNSSWKNGAPAKAEAEVAE